VTQQDRTPAGAHRFSDVVPVARVPVGAGPAVTIVMITAMSRAPARPAGKPSAVHRRAPTSWSRSAGKAVPEETDRLGRLALWPLCRST
jgi:hypothetical protein